MPQSLLCSEHSMAPISFIPKAQVLPTALHTISLSPPCLISSAPSLTPSAPATWASSQFHKHAGCCPASGPLHWPFPLLRTLFPQVPTRPPALLPSGLYLNIMSSARPSLMPLFKIPPPCFISFSFSSLCRFYFHFLLRRVFIAMRRLSLAAACRGYSPGGWCAGFSWQWLLLLQSTGCRCSTWSQQLWLKGCWSSSSLAVAHGLSCPIACGIFQGLNPCLLHCKMDP